MRQESESQQNSVSGYTVESGESRKERIDKKRAIRKNKVGFINEESFEQKQDKRFLTKQQKMQLQKAKNRQAAQRSRDQHKKYVQTLEEQNRVLREELSRPRFCAKCSKEISFESQLSTDPSSTEFQHQRHFETFVQNQNIHEQDDFQSPFMRMSDYEDSSPLKMLLFISMIILGVMVLNGSTDGPTVEGITLKRDLMQIPNQKVIQTPNVNNGQIKPQIQIQASELKFKQLQEISRFDLMNQIENSFNMEDSDENDKIMTEVVPLSYQLSALSQQSCLKSIINDNYTQVSYAFPTKLQQKSASKLRSHDSHQMQIFYPQVKQQKNNLLFCSLPKLYKKSGEVGSNLFSKFIDIIISGSQMMEIIGKSPNLWMSKIVNFNGIYKINAQVKEIVQIEDNNCIL